MLSVSFCLLQVCKGFPTMFFSGNFIVSAFMFSLTFPVNCAWYEVRVKGHILLPERSICLGIICWKDISFPAQLPWHLLKINLITTKRMQGSMKKWLIPQLRQKMWGELGASCAGRQEVLKKGEWVCPKDTGAGMEWLLWLELEQCEQKHKWWQYWILTEQNICASIQL